MDRQRSVAGRAVPAWCVAWLGVLLVGSPALSQVLQYGDGTAAGKRSIGGSGHLTMFEAPKDGLWLNRIEVFGSRYGSAEPPDEDFAVYVVDGEQHVVRQVALPYLLWQRSDQYWRTLPIPPLKVGQRFGIGLNFHPTQYKGAYVGTTAGAGTHSFTWLPGTEAVPLPNMEWMIRVTVGESPEGDPKAGDLLVRTDGEAFFDRVLTAAGDPLTVNLAGRGKLPKSEVATIRWGNVTAPSAGQSVVVLLSGMRVEGQLVAVDEKVLRVRVGDAERQIPRTDVARIDFR